MPAGRLPTEVRFSDVLCSPLEFDVPLAPIGQKHSPTLGRAIAELSNIVGQHRKEISD